MTEGFECKRSRRPQQYDLSESQASSRRLPRQTSRLLTASLSLTTRLTYGEVQQGLQTSHSRCTFSKAAGYKRFDCFILGHGSHANATCLPKTILIGSYSSHERAQDSLERFPNLLLRTFKKKRNRTEGLDLRFGSFASGQLLQRASPGQRRRFAPEHQLRRQKDVSCACLSTIGFADTQHHLKRTPRTKTAGLWRPCICEADVVTYEEIRHVSKPSKTLSLHS
jgi:hypothetical protein